MEAHILLWLVLLPLVGVGLCLTLAARLAKWIALAVTLGGFALAVDLYFRFSAEHAADFQWAISYPWMSAYQINFALAVDGLSFPLVLLTKFMMPIAILASFGETRKERAFMCCFLALDVAMTGTFLATDLFLFYVFWELMLIPMLLIIGVWGSAERVYASLKFFLFTFLGSLLMLVAIFWVVLHHQTQTGVVTGNLNALYAMSFPTEPVWMGLTARDLIFLAFTIAFAVKIPLFPFHTWLPDAHVQAPTGGSILLAAVLLKMGTYGMLRLAIPICHDSFVTFAPTLAGLSLAGILYGAWVAFQQTDMKKLVAYSSVSHLGFVMLGICASNGTALTGAVLQMVNHGLSTGALFLLVGALYERRHSRNFTDFGGLAEIVPWYAFFLVFVAASSMGVPGLNGFVGEFLVLLGTNQTSALWSGLAVLGIIFGAVYTLTMIRKVLFGPSLSAENRMLKDLSVRDWAGLVPLCLFILFLGLYPQPFLNKLGNSVSDYWQHLSPSKAPQTMSQDSIKRNHRS
jgi:NADH-quinone oxidoreductase subunit M